MTTAPTSLTSPERHGLGDAIRTWWEGLPRVMQWLVGVPLIILIALLPVINPPLITTTATNFGVVMATFAMTALIAIGLNVVVGQTGLLDLGYVGFYAVGAYVVALLTSPSSPLWGSTDHGFFSGPWAWLACVPLAIIITGITGVILGTPTLRVRGDYLAIVTLGFGEIVRLLADNLTDVTNGATGLQSVLYPEIGRSADSPGGVFSTANNTSSLNYGVWWYWFGIAAVIIVLIVIGNLERSRVGRSWVASARTRTPPRSWVCRPSNTNCGRSSSERHRRPVRGVLRGAGAVCRPDGVHRHQLHAVPVCGGPRRPGQQARRDRRSVHHHLPAARVQGISVGGEALSEYKYLFFGIALVVLMIFRPQGLFPARARLITFGRQVYAAIRRTPKRATPTEEAAA